MSEEAENPLEFKSNYILRLLSKDYNPFAPNVIKVDDKYVEVRKRNWHLFSVDISKYHFQNIIGFQVDKHFLGADVVIETSGDASMRVKGFSKGKADKINKHCESYITEHSQKNRDDNIGQAISEALDKSGNNQNSAADEIKKLKDLKDDGVLTEEEFEKKKKELMG